MRDVILTDENTDNLPKIISITLQTQGNSNSKVYKRDSQFNLKYSLIRGKTLKLLQKQKKDQEQFENMKKCKPIMTECDDFKGMIMNKSRNNNKNKSMINEDSHIKSNIFLSMNNNSSSTQIKIHKLTPFQLYIKKLNQNNNAFKERQLLFKPKLDSDFHLTNYNTFSLRNNNNDDDNKKNIRVKSMRNKESKICLIKLKKDTIKQKLPTVVLKECHNKGNMQSYSFNDLLFVKSLNR